MPAVQMDALGAFTYLTENTPTWISQISELSAHTASKRAEYAQAYKQHTAVRRQRRRRNSSVCSIHTDTDPSPQPSAGETRGDITTTPETSHHQSAANPPKHGAEDVPPLGDSDSIEHNLCVSTRHNLIIHYDGHTQKTLEELVRNIGTARNNIRKARMSSPRLGYSMLSRNPLMNSSMALLASAETTDEDVLSNIRRARDRNPAVPAKESLEKADKFLEVVHGICETAAYCFLRLGDCSKELATVEERLKTVLNLATKEADQLRAKQPPTEKEAVGRITPVTKAPTEQPFSLSKTNDAIEVDDDDGSEYGEPIDLTVFRVNRARR
ncbi:hypothetical protein BO70DRAFT_363990 [Aspergillus heteromorphus CBS 117.55]|uniref:Uncharacterized protein n=1 Tax=Aspergillus heteromorphus CBS 117.55 TaxID=1448321 RepID=A0A317VP79_9EURO|nr:uncharacterized protein BO70DRAFT_363990 [Aspergillus heteromorphus CBS 117.55]PWY75419.1 hypothetical protein BO70DRAFT_363990 [Aspergillus heteromorphus CBS 117.55]